MTVQLTATQRAKLRRIRPPYYCVCGQVITSENPMIASVQNQNGQSGRGGTHLAPVHAEICPFVEGYGVVKSIGRLAELR